MLKKDDTVMLSISDMGVDGEGLGRADGIPVFVKDAIIGDRALVKIIKMKKSYGYGRLIEVAEPSPWRVEPRCEFHRQCGGCQLQAMEYQKQLEYKENMVCNNLMRIGGYDGACLKSMQEPICGMEEPFHYRNKAQFPVGRDKEGRIVTGFYASRSHQIIANRKCCLGAEENEQILNLVIDFMEKHDIEPYHEAEGVGLVRHILIRKGFATGELMVCIVVNGRSLPHSKQLVKELCKLKGMVSISLNVNQRKTNVILGDEVIPLWGEPYLTDAIGALQFRISPLSFYQVNLTQARRLYGKALEYAGLTGQETVWDLYCGIGTISLFLAQKARMVYGVESVPSAIADAKQNAALNGITNVRFLEGKAEEILPSFYGQACAGKEGAGAMHGPQVGQEESVGGEPDGAEALRRPDVIVVDPPRKGCDERCLSVMAQMRPQRIVYVSCDSATLARDLKCLRGHGYELRRWQAVDLFPMTGAHVEVVCVLSKSDVEHHAGKGEDFQNVVIANDLAVRYNKCDKNVHTFVEM